jgi:hypothetical protein
MAQPAQHAAPVMGAAAGFHDHLGGRELAEEGFHLGALEVAPQHCTLLCINAMQGEHVLGDVDRNALILHVDGPWLVHDNPTVARNAVGPSTPTTA